MARRAVPLWARWAIIGVLLLSAFVVGSGVLTTKPQTDAERAASLDARLKCPGCQGLSVSESASASSLAVRRQVLTDIEAGRSDAEITALLEARYGNSVLLTPPPGGLSDLLWLFPIALAIGIAAAVVAVVLRRRMPSAPKADHV